jgi:hypothetical protein
LAKASFLPFKTAPTLLLARGRRGSSPNGFKRGTSLVPGLVDVDDAEDEEGAGDEVPGVV